MPFLMPTGSLRRFFLALGTWPAQRACAAHTNSIESVWAVLKRGLHGVYHHASPKHLHRYVDEFTWRLNDGDVKRHALRRLESFVDAIVGKRLTYQRLIAGGRS